MSFNGSGTFNINTAGQPVVTGTVISSSVFNALTADLATGLSTCITKDGQTTVTANIPMNSFKFTGLAAGTAATDSVRLGQLQAGAATLITVTGTNTYAGTMTPALSAYAAGNTFSFLVPNTNTTSCTLNIDGLGAKSITRDGTTALVAGDLVANSEVVVVYDGTQFQVLNSNSKTNFNLSGTLTVAGNTTLSGGTANQVQYLNASKVLSGSANLTFDGTTLTANALTTSSTVTINGGTANGVAYLNGSKVLTTGSALTFDGTTFNNTAGAIRTSDELSALGGRLALYRAAGASYFDWASGQDLIWRTVTSVGGGGASEQMRLTSTGLGIGTSSPGSKLSVEGANTTDGPTNFLTNLRNSGAQTSGVGTGIAFSQKMSSFNAVLATVEGIKENATTDNYASAMVFSTRANGQNLAERARIDSSGNLGLGVTPSAWGSPFKALDMTVSGFANEGSVATHIAQNCYYNGTNWIYKTTNLAGRYLEYAGQHIWYTAPSGTAGNAISFTQAMTLDNAGTLTVGDGSILNQIQVNSSAWANYILKSPNTNGGSIYWNNGTTNKGEIFYYHLADYMSFTTNSSERARIDSSGNLLVGTTNSSNTVGSGLKVLPSANGANSGQVAIVTAASGSGSTSLWVYSTGAGAARFYVNDAGTIFATNTTISAISDQRFKENVRDLDVGLAQVLALQPRVFDWKAGKGKDIKGDRGFIAQEFEQVFPELIDVWADPAPEGEEPYKSVRQDLIPVLVKAMQEQQAMIEELKARIVTLENK